MSAPAAHSDKYVMIGIYLQWADDLGLGLLLRQHRLRDLHALLDRHRRGSSRHLDTLTTGYFTTT